MLSPFQHSEVKPYSDLSLLGFNSICLQQNNPPCSYESSPMEVNTVPGLTHSNTIHVPFKNTKSYKIISGEKQDKQLL